MNRIIATLAVGLITSSGASAKDLAFYKATYEKEMETIVLSHGMNMAELSENYTEALDALLAKVKKAGDLDKTTAVMQEINRFAADKAMPTTTSALLDIQNLQTRFTKQASTQGSDKDRKIIALVSKYDQALERLQKSLVASGSLDKAKEVQTERQRTAGSHAVTQAKRQISRNVPAALTTKKKRPPVALRNIAGSARIQASSEYNGDLTASQIVDGASGEWASLGEGKGAWVRLTWPSPHLIHKIRLQDRPNPTERVMDAIVQIGSFHSVKTGALPNDGSPKTIDLGQPWKTTWVAIKITKSQGPNIGLMEVEVLAE